MSLKFIKRENIPDRYKDAMKDIWETVTKGEHESRDSIEKCLRDLGKKHFCSIDLFSYSECYGKSLFTHRFTCSFIKKIGILNNKVLEKQEIIEAQYQMRGIAPLPFKDLEFMCDI